MLLGIRADVGLRPEDLSMSTFDPFIVLPGSHRADFGGELVGKPGSNETIQVVFHLRRKRALHMHGLFAAGLFLPRQVLEAQFGQSEDDLAAVLEFANDYGLWRDNIEREKRLVTFHASLRVIEHAFKVSLELRNQNGRVHRVRTGPIYLPRSLVGIVTGVFGLDDRPQASPHLVRSRSFERSIFKPNAFDGQQLAQIYDFPQGDGSGRTIALIELGGAVFTPDLETFFQQLRLPLPQIKDISVNGGLTLPGVDPAADGEVTLDVEVAGAVAPKANILIYHAPNDDVGFLQAVLTAVHDGVNSPDVISISWGQAESGWTQQMMTAMDDAFQSAAAIGISVFVAAGDDGANDNQNDGRAHVDFPASSPFVTACGGTTLLVSNARQESVWNDGNGSATGGGISDFFERPPYQAGITMPPNLATSKTGRGLPDVSAVADPQTGYAVYLHGVWQVFGGTSAVAPLLAAMTLRFAQALGHRVGLLNTRIYGGNANTVFNDVVSGNNSCDGITGYSAAPGWDAVTGFGSPKGQSLLSLFLNPNPPPA
jgi:kumamolisin